jgi:pyridoxine 5-phosphate synthase
MTSLSVNINKLATIRNARGGNNPDLIYWADKIQKLGAHGITIHPRPDERHIRQQDVFDLKPHVTTEFNIEGYPNAAFIKLIQKIKPDQCTLVPDPPEVLTSNAGWNLATQEDILLKVLPKLTPHTRVSIFVEPKTTSLETAKKLKNMGVLRAEIYTEDFAKHPDDAEVLKRYRDCADQLLKAGLELNAGHDLDLNNLGRLISLIPEIKEVSIGHALICDSLELGMSKTIESYLKVLKHDTKN